MKYYPLRRSRWKLLKSYIGWEDYVGFAILLLGVFGFISGSIPFVQWLTPAYYEIRSELVGIGITVLIIDNANEVIKRREEKKRLILQMGSPDNSFANEAVRQLKETGWLYDGSLQGANLWGANLRDIELATANLERVDLSNANLNSAYLGGANLRHASLVGSDLQYSDNEGVHLHAADLERANLTGSCLAIADLSKARLTETNLSGANLSYANLQNATFYRTNLKGAILKDAKVTKGQFDEVLSLEGATMPNGIIHE